MTAMSSSCRATRSSTCSRLTILMDKSSLAKPATPDPAKAASRRRPARTPPTGSSTWTAPGPVKVDLEDPDRDGRQRQLRQGPQQRGAERPCRADRRPQRHQGRPAGLRPQHRPGGGAGRRFARAGPFPARQRRHARRARRRSSAMVRISRDRRGASRPTGRAPRRSDAGAAAPSALGTLAVYNLGKRYGARTVVQDVSLVVRQGEAVGLLGPNGAGKTTVFYMITGLVKPDKGVIALDGQRRHRAADVPARPARRRLSAAGSLDFPRPQCRGQHPRGARSQRARQGARGSGGWNNCWRSSTSRGCARRPPSRCRAASGGAARSRARWRRKPAFILLDEPFAGIDPIAVGDIQDLVRHLKQRGIGVLITDHNVRETLGLIDRAYIIHSGAC